MTLYKKLLSALTIGVVSTAMVSCDNDFDYPPVIIPESPMASQVNTTIAEIKAMYWDDARNYISTIRYNSNGEHFIISGRVIANDETGNIYKNIIIQDETAAMTISIDAKNLYTNYKIGQEVVLDLTDMYIGKYNGLQQLGYPEWYAAGDTWEASFMSEEFFTEHSEINGLPKPEAVIVNKMTIPEILAMNSAEDQQRWQSQLIELEDVEFENGGRLRFAESGSNTNRTLRDGQGNKITVRNSGYATFAADVLPEGRGNVVAILSYYGTGWQLLLRDKSDLTGFTWPDITIEDVKPAGTGTVEDPFNVTRALENIISGNYTADKVYVEGVVSSIKEIDTSNYGTSIFFIADEGNLGQELEIYHCKYLNNTKFTSTEQLKVGDKVVVYGELTYYNNKTPEMTQGCYLYSINGETQPGDPPVTPPAAGATFKKVSSITSGKQYVFVYNGQVGTAIAERYSYGRLALQNVSITDGTLKTDLKNALTITAAEGGYTIVDCYGRYLSIASGYLTNFQLPKEINGGGATSIWTGTEANGTVQFTLSMDGTTIAIAQSGTYTNISPTDIGKYTPNYPEIYELVE